MGDFSYYHLNWVNAHSSHDKEATFLDMINDCFIEQLVMELTSGEMPLDFILSRAENLMRNFTECAYLNGLYPALSIPKDLCCPCPIQE